MDKKFKIFVIVALVALAGLAATAVFVALNVMNKASQASSNENTKIQSKSTVLISVKEAITSNIQQDDNSYHMMRVQVAIEVDEKDKRYKEFSEDFKAKEAKVRDAIIRVLREQTYEMAIAEGAQDKVATQITNVLNEMFGMDIIQNTVFSDFFVQ